MSGQTVSITVSIKVAAAKAGNAFVVVASNSYLNKATLALIDRLGVMSLVQAGGSLKFCQLAEVAADIYPRLVPAQGAGGVVVDFQGVPCRTASPMYNILPSSPPERRL